MTGEPVQDREALTQSVKASLRKAEARTAGLQKANTRLLVAGIVSSTATTLVAVITAAQGPIVGEGVEGWRLACIVAAVFGFASTVCTGLTQQLKISDRLSEGNQCLGKLRALDVAITTGSRSWEEIVKEYEEIARACP
jgi:hypothetical protein